MTFLSLDAIADEGERGVLMDALARPAVRQLRSAREVTARRECFETGGGDEQTSR